jgi:hypothetical protein
MLAGSMRRAPLLSSTAALVFGLVLVAGTRAVHAQTRAREAEAAFQRGLLAMQGGRHEEALLAFEASYEANPLPVVLFNLGIANASLQRPHPSVVAFEKYLDAADPETEGSNVAAVRAEVERLRKGSCVIQPTLFPVHAVVTVDGRAADPWRGEILLAPGARELAVRADGYRTHIQNVNAVPGRFLIEIRLEPDSAGGSPPPTVPVVPPTELPSQTRPAHDAPAPAPRHAAPAPVAPPTATAASEPTRPRGEVRCAGGEWCLGPVVTGGLPTLIGPGFHARSEHFGFGLDFQITPTLALGDGALGLYMLSGTIRVFPFGGIFFLDAGVAYYHASGIAIATDPRTGESVEGEGDAGFPAFVLGLGLLGRDGFVFGIDFAAILALAATDIDVRIVRGDGEGALASTVREVVTDTVNGVVDSLPFVPQLNLLRLGYLF